MAVIGPKKLLELVNEKGLVKNLSERELTNPEGAVIDIRLGAIYEISGEAFLGITERKTPEVKKVAEYREGEKDNWFIVEPNSFHLISTIEEFDVPIDITVNIFPRRTTYMSGLNIMRGNCAPGFKGKFTFGMKNAGPLPVKLELGCRIVSVQFLWIDGEGSAYRGQWMGGRVTTDGKETQV